MIVFGSVMEYRAWERCKRYARSVQHRHFISAYYSKNGLYTVSWMIIAGQTGFLRMLQQETMESYFTIPYRGYPSLDFTLTEQGAARYGTTFTAAWVESRCDNDMGRIKELWTAGGRLSFIRKENVKDGNAVEITGYLHSEVLCSFKVLE